MGHQSEERPRGWDTARLLRPTLGHSTQALHHRPPPLPDRTTTHAPTSEEVWGSAARSKHSEMRRRRREASSTVLNDRVFSLTPWMLKVLLTDLGQTGGGDAIKG